MVICPECGKEFEPRRWSAKYCSKKCQKDHGRPKGERKKAMDAAYAKANPEKIKVYKKKYYQENKATVKANAVKWAEDNPERRREIRLASRKKHKDARNSHVRQYLKENPDVLAKKRSRTTTWKKEHPENHRATENKRRTSKTLAGGFFTPEEWFMLCFAVGFICVCCKKAKPLEADHIVPVSLGGSSWLWNIQPLCKSCNASKGAKIIDYRETLGDHNKCLMTFQQLQD